MKTKKRKITGVESIRRAAPTLNRIRRSGKFCCIEIRSDYHYCWDVALRSPAFKSHHHTANVGGYDDLRKALLAAEKKALTMATKGRRIKGQ